MFVKRLLPIVIVICLIGAFLSCLPTIGESRKEFKTLDDFNGAKVGVQTGCNYEIMLQEICPDVDIEFFTDSGSLIPAVRSGKLDAYITESTTFAIEGKDNPSLVAFPESFGREYGRIGVTKLGTGSLVLDQLNEFIAKIKENGTIDDMANYWVYDYDRDNCTLDKSGITGENGKLMCTSEADYEPFCFAGVGGELSGYDIDFIYRFCREYGYEPVIDPFDYEAMSPAVTSGKYTIALGLIADDERAEEIFFSDSYTKFDLILVYDSPINDDTTFVENLKDNFNKTFIKEDRWKMFLEGSGITLLISVSSIILGSIFGLALYLWCMHGKKAEQKFTDVFSWLIGSTPSVVLIMVLYYVVFEKYVISNMIVSIMGFTLLFGCAFYELIVSGVKAVGNGQREAALAQGFNEDQTFFRIIFPQAAEHFFPGYKSEVVSLIQETSIVGYIAVLDLTKMSDLVRGRTYNAFFSLLATAAIYYLLILIVTKMVSNVEFRTNKKNRKIERVERKLNGTTAK